jgi:hypothetical protein
MSHVVSGKLRKQPFVKDGCGQDGQSRMYAIELAEVTKDFKTGEKSYTNYKAMMFAKSPAAKDYYDKALAEGSYVVMACEKLKVEQREHNGTTYITLQMDNPRLEGANFEDSPSGHQQPQQQPRQAPPYYTEPPHDFDDDLAF